MLGVSYYKLNKWLTWPQNRVQYYNVHRTKICIPRSAHPEATLTINQHTHIAKRRKACQLKTTNWIKSYPHHQTHDGTAQLHLNPLNLKFKLLRPSNENTIRAFKSIRHVSIVSLFMASALNLSPLIIAFLLFRRCCCCHLTD